MLNGIIMLSIMTRMIADLRVRSCGRFANTTHVPHSLDDVVFEPRRRSDGTREFTFDSKLD